VQWKSGREFSLGTKHKVSDKDDCKKESGEGRERKGTGRVDVNKQSGKE
jgi:hypothetical protein